MNLVHASLNPQGPNYQIWRELLGCDRVPLKSARPFRADLGGEKEVENEVEGVECYLLDVAALPLWKRAKLLDHLARKFSAKTWEIDAEIALNHGGFPIRAADLIVSYSMRAFL